MSELNENVAEETAETAVEAVAESRQEPVIIEEAPVKLSRKSAIAALLEGDIEFPEMDESAFGKMIESSLTAIKEDEMVHGTIRAISKDEILVDIGFKSLGVIPRAEFSVAADLLSVGDGIDVFVDKIEDGNGRLVLSRKRADFMKTWNDIMAHYEKQDIIQVRILRRIKGGMVVDLLGIEAFLPGSQIDTRPVRDFDAWVGKTIDVRVVKVNNPSENVVVSHKVLLEEQLTEQRGKILDSLDKGLVLEGVVKAISDFGVFVDLGGVDGLVHITDLSWGRVNHPSEIVTLDSTVKVVVLDFDGDKKRISLGMKQLTPHPWDTIGEKYDTSTRVKGKVVSITDYGVFIEIEKGIEGLIHISEMSWTQHIKHPSQLVSLGQVLEAVVLNIDKDTRKLALGMKQLEPDPWQDLMNKYPVGSVHKGIVRNLTNFGVFVELEPGVDGLVHISDLSWTKKIRHPGEFVKKGDSLDVIVLTIDPEHRRISLGHKQITENPWDVFAERFTVGTETEGKIVRIIDKGVIVEMPEGVDGFVPSSQLSFAPVRSIADFFHVGDNLPLKVVEFDKEAKKIVLSAVDALKDKDADVINTYNTAHPVPNADKYVAEGGQPIAPEEVAAIAAVVGEELQGLPYEAPVTEEAAAPAA
ncbi:MAG: 30S ribosomal protein S1, partial [Candidatus Kapabacteria bacterium]|nr:30S ribosomal protein S1 [Candidatus Kapabacteria bacterium]